MGSNPLIMVLNTPYHWGGECTISLSPGGRGLGRGGKTAAFLFVPRSVAAA